MKTRFLSLIVVLLATAIVRAQLPPDKALASLKVADGLQVELFASEPLFTNPTCIDVDHRGRVWVCESVNYRTTLRRTKPNRVEGDRIVVLEDTDGDGKADKATTFYQHPDFLAPLGVAVAKDAVGPGYKVYVCHSPDLYVFEDRDGDLKADGPPTKLLSGFGGYDHDHGIHSVLIGPDNKLYFTVGDTGVKDLKSSDGKGRSWTSNATDCRAATVWRCDLDGKNLQLIAHNFRNNYECCVDSFGEIWLSDNDDDGNQQTRICHVLPGGDYGYHPRGPGQSHWHEEQPGIVHKTLRTGFGSPTGICFYEGSLMPALRDQLLHCDAGPREVRSFLRKPKGAGYELDKTLLLTSSDTWFRPSDVCVAPDGSVFVSDWYDPGVGGHGMGDITRGRIYRLTPKGHKGYKVPAFGLATKEGVAEALSSPCLARRAAALAAIDRMKTVDEIMAVVDHLYGAGPSSYKARLFWAITPPARVIKKGADRLPSALGYAMMPLGDERDRLLAMLLRLDRDQTGNDFLNVDKTLTHTKPEEYLKTFRFDAAGRRELLLTLREEDVTFVTPLFYSLAKKYEGGDLFYRAALNIAAGTDPQRRDKLLADFDKHFPHWNDNVADLVWELRPKSVLPRLGKLLDDATLTAAQKGRIVDILAVTDDPAAGRHLIGLLKGQTPAAVRDRAVANLILFLPTKWSSLRQDEGLGDAVGRMLKSRDHAVTGLRLAAAAPDCTSFENIEELARDVEAPRAVRAEAVRTLGKIPNVKTVRMLAPLVSDRLVGAEAVAALAAQVTGRGESAAAKAALDLLQKTVLDDMADADLRRAAVDGLAATQPGTQWLLGQKERNALPTTLVADTGRLLRNSPFQALRNRALIAFPPPGKLDPKKLPTVASLASRRGDVNHGKTLLAASVKNDTQCLKCHALHGKGGGVGPDLATIGQKGSRENLVESILLPSKAIADQYVTWLIETKKGVTVAGLLVEETPTAVTLRDGNGKDTKIDKKEIDNRTKSPTSLMPDDLLRYMTEDDLVDIVEYLLTLK